MGFGFNSTIKKNMKPCASCGKSCYWFSKKRCQDCARIEDTMKRMESETDKVIQEEDLSGLIDDADAIFSHFIRLKYADRNGRVACFTCGWIKHWTLQQCGHYMKRANLYLRFDERNCRPQCKTCNEDLDGNMPEYTARLEKECQGITDILKSEIRLVHKPTREEIRQVIAEYTPKVKELKKKLTNHLQ